VSFFRPARKVVDPDGRKWEIYVSRGLLTVLGLARRQRPVNVEAVSFFPGQKHHRWTTTSDHAAAVVEQVARGMEKGEIARPLGAVFDDAFSRAHR
jgi:hypothetical protein